MWHAIIPYLLNGGIDFIMSMLALAIWFHFDLEGWWEQRNHARQIRRGEKLDRQDLKTKIIDATESDLEHESS